MAPNISFKAILFLSSAFLCMPFSVIAKSHPPSHTASIGLPPALAPTPADTLPGPAPAHGAHALSPAPAHGGRVHAPAPNGNAPSRSYDGPAPAPAPAPYGYAPAPGPGSAGGNEPVPADEAQLDDWFHRNVEPLASRKASLDAELVAAEEGSPKIINLKADGKGDFATLSDALNSIPEGNKARVVIKLGPGNYTEKVTIPPTKPFVTLYGDPKNMPVIVYGGTAASYGPVDSASLTVESDYFVAVNVVVANSAPRPTGMMQGGQGLALKMEGSKAALYNCKFHGYQNTLCDYSGLHFYKDCYIEGTADFIFGKGKSIFLNVETHVVPGSNESWITAQSRHDDNEDTGFSFIHGSVTGTGGKAYLGRTWIPYARVVFAYTNMSNAIHPQGWSDNKHPETQKTAFFGEYRSKGPGGKLSGRPRFVKNLTDADVQPFLSLDFIQGSKWLLPPPQI